MDWTTYPDDGAVIDGDDSTRTAWVRAVPDAVPVPRPYTDDENKAADALAADALARAEHAAARAAVRGILDDIDAQQVRAREVIDSPSASAEDRKVARATLRLAAAVKDLARLARGLA